MRNKLLQRFQTYLVILCVSTFLVMLLGSWVRATDSGLACPDWPLCYDKAIPYFNYQIFLEWFHRLLAGFLSIGFLILVVWVFKTQVLRKLYAKEFLLAFALLTWQVILGGLTVLQLLDPKIVSLHLINALAFLTLLFVLTFKARYLAHNGLSPKSLLKSSTHKSLQISLAVLATMIFLQVFLGGLVSTHHAGMACPDFPTCYGTWFPVFAWLPWLQMSHRFLAFAIVAMFVLCLYKQFQFKDLHKHFIAMWALRFIPICLAAQIFLGVWNVWYGIPVYASVAHHGNALLLFLVTLSAYLDLKFDIQPASSTIHQGQPKHAGFSEGAVVCK